MTFSIPPCFSLLFSGEKNTGLFFLDFLFIFTTSRRKYSSSGQKKQFKVYYLLSKTDWEKIQSHPTFLLAKSYIRFMHIDLAVPDEPLINYCLCRKVTSKDLQLLTGKQQELFS